MDRNKAKTLHSSNKTHTRKPENLSFSFFCNTYLKDLLKASRGPFIFFPISWTSFYTNPFLCLLFTLLGGADFVGILQIWQQVCSFCRLFLQSVFIADWFCDPIILRGFLFFLFVVVLYCFYLIVSLMILTFRPSLYW